MSKKSLLLSFAIISLLLSACATDNVKTSKKSSGDIYYVKDNSYYVTKKDGTRYVLSEDDVEYNAAYTKRKNKEIYDSQDIIDFNMFFEFMTIELDQNKSSLLKKFEDRNYSPDNYFDFSKNLSVTEKGYNETTKSFSFNISTTSIVKRESIKEAIDDESIYIGKESKNEPINGSNIDILNGVNNIHQNEYYHDIKNNCIYYYTSEHEFKCYNYENINDILIDSSVNRIRMYGKNVIYFKNNSVVFYTIGKGIEVSYDIEKYNNVYFKKDDSENVYVSSYNDGLNLYIVNKKTGIKLIDEGLDKIFGVTKNKIFYSKVSYNNLPYKNVLIDDVSTGEYLGEEPILEKYKLNDDPLSPEYDLDKYIPDRFAYKIKEKYLNDRKNYIDKYINGIKDGGEEIAVKTLVCSDGNNKSVINEDGVVNVIILDYEKDIIYYETDLNLGSLSIEKKRLSEFVTSSYSIDNYISQLIYNVKKQYLYYIYKAGTIHHINGLDLYRKFIEKDSFLLYDAEHNKTLNELEIRDIHYEKDNVFISGVSASDYNKVAYNITIDKNKELFADAINMNGYNDINYIGFLDSPIYLLEGENNITVLRHGIKELSKNVYLGSVVINDKKSAIAYVVKNSDDEINYNGELHKVNVKNNDEDTIISEKAFAYNVVFDSDTGDLLYLLNYSAEEDVGTLICVDSNNKKYFIDDKVLYILKY